MERTIRAHLLLDEQSLSRLDHIASGYGVSRSAAVRLLLRNAPVLDLEGA